jgi:hypothetical protein
MLDDKQALLFVEKNPAGFLITTRAQFDKLQSKLPAEVKIISEQPLFESQFKMNLSKLFTPEFRQPPKQLVVIGREKASVIATRRRRLTPTVISVRGSGVFSGSVRNLRERVDRKILPTLFGPANPSTVGYA